MHKALAIAAALALCGCARSATMQLSADTFQLVTSAAPVCGRAGAQNVAARRAANAISARATLGPKWQEAIKESAATTC